MRYLGGKTRLAKKIVPILEGLRKEGQPYLEPFCGSFAVGERMSGIRVASDYNPYIVAVLQAAKDGVVFPDDVSFDDYMDVKGNKEDYPAWYVGFVGFGLSFGGKWFGGYARDVRRGGVNFADVAKRGLEKQAKLIQDVTFLSTSYAEFNPSDTLIYCDPPYDNTTGYGATGSFDSVAFWLKCLNWAALGNTVVVSEYTTLLSSATVIAEFGHNTALDSGRVTVTRTTEKLFLVGA